MQLQAIGPVLKPLVHAPVEDLATVPASPYFSAQRFILDRVNYERTAARPADLSLVRMGRLVEQLGDPHLAAPVFHVAGTKGKGSVAAMLAHALAASGCRTGLYTSPHLVRIEERMRIDGQPCSPQQLVDLVDAVRQPVAELERDGEGPTFFELTTALAMLHFQRERADWVVLETGLGGRLDSTNVCQPEASIITSISYDHVRLLGATLPEIAGEKCGIIKPGRLVVSGVREPSARDVVRRTAQQRGCPLVELEHDFHVRRVRLETDPAPATVFDYQSDQLLRDVRLGLLGERQARNAALVIATLQQSGVAAAAATLREGLAAARWPARIELLGRQPLVILDVAHNAASAEALVQVLDQCFARPPGGRRRLLFAASGDKDPRGMLSQLAPNFDEVVLTKYVKNPRGMPLDRLQAIAEPLGTPLRRLEDPVAAWRSLLSESSAADMICVAGSFFLAAELRDVIRSDLAQVGEPSA